MSAVPSITLLSPSIRQNASLLRTPRIPPIDPNFLSKINYNENDLILQAETPVPTHRKPSLLKLLPKREEGPINPSSFRD